MGAIHVLGDETWELPAFTFPATPAAVLAAGRRPLFVDVDQGTLAMSPSRNPMGGSVPVAPFGAAPDLVGWASLGSVVHDAAASFGSEPDLSGLPSGQAVVFSLHSTKVLGAGEGSVVIFADPEAATEFRRWTNFGFAGTRDSVSSGINGKMSEVQAAYAHAALDQWHTERMEWQEARRKVRQVARDVDLECFESHDEWVSPYWIARFSGPESCGTAETVLARHGVETRRWWSRGCHRMPAFGSVDSEQLPVTDGVASSYLGLPMFRGLTDEHVERIQVALTAARAELAAW